MKYPVYRPAEPAGEPYVKSDVAPEGSFLVTPTAAAAPRAPSATHGPSAILSMSRRSVVASLAAAFAPAVPAASPSFAAAATTSVDPIFPLIEAYKSARKRKLKAYEAIAAFEETHHELLYREPELLVGIDNGMKIVATTHEQIDQQFDWYDRYFAQNHDSHRRMAHEMFEAEVQKIKQLKDATGITAAEAVEDRACEEQDAALEAVMRQEPKTLQGLAAYAAVAARQDFTDHDRMAIVVLASALKALAGAASVA